MLESPSKLGGLRQPLEYMARGEPGTNPRSNIVVEADRCMIPTFLFQKIVEKKINKGRSMMVTYLDFT